MPLNDTQMHSAEGVVASWPEYNGLLLHGSHLEAVQQRRQTGRHTDACLLVLACRVRPDVVALVVATLHNARAADLCV